MQLTELITIISISLNSILGLLILGYKPGKRLNQLFFFLVCSLVGWIFSLELYLSLYRSEAAFLFWGRINFVATTSLGYFVLFFTNEFPEGNSLIKKHFIKIVYTALTLFLVYITIFSPYIDEKEEYLNGEYNTIYGILYPLFILHFAGSMLVSVIILLIKRRRSEKISKRQITIITIGIVLSSIFAISTNLFLPYLFGNFLLQHYGPLGTTFFTLSVTYAILRYQFLDVRILVGRIVYYALIGSLFYLTYFTIYFFDIISFGGSETTGGVLSGIPNAIIFAMVFVWLNNFLRKQVRTRIINPGYDPLEETDQLSRKIATHLSIRDISQSTLETLSRTIRAKYQAVLVIPGEDFEKSAEKKYLQELGDKKEVKMESLEKLKAIWDKAGKFPIVYDELELEIPRHFRGLESEIEAVMKSMASSKLKIIMPLKQSEENFAMLLIGEKEADSPYTNQDVGYLDGIATTLGLAITRSLYYLEVEDLNKNLQKRIDEATEEISQKNKDLEDTLDKLEEVRRQERDMIDVMGHELRTPITIVRNSLMILQSKIKKKEKITESELANYIEKASEGAKRELDLVETLLSATKVESNRIQLLLTQLDANQVVENAIEAHEHFAKEKDVKIVYTKPKKETLIYADKTRFQEVIDNLVSNAIKYTLEGEVTVEITENDKNVLFTVTDEGIGIAKEDMKYLGKKFFRAKQHIPTSKGADGNGVVRPGGTGLGLYVAFNLMKLMNGKIDVKSEIGKGSTFTATIPKFIGQEDRQFDQTFED
ncbi:hypothetical protein JW978_04120 [Candidatus Dojkabacteria bacterium]|nr:hypothetical protein [Candidatus Dojkabacteria bacterium]